MNTRRSLWIGASCLAIGWLLAALTVFKLLPPSLVSAVVVFALLLVGTIVGFYGLFTLFRAHYSAR